jgi:hypothetical protein
MNLTITEIEFIYNAGYKRGMLVGFVIIITIISSIYLLK